MSKMATRSRREHPHQIICANYLTECDELVRLCLDEDMLNFDVFSNLWLETKMGFLNKGKTGPEAAMLAQLMLYIGKQYLIKDTTNFRESVIGAYLVYVFLALQPDKRIAFMKVHYKDIPILKQIKRSALRHRNNEVLYILQKIITDVPEGYQQALREFEIVDSKWKYDSTPLETLQEELEDLSRKFNEDRWGRSHRHSAAKRRRTDRDE